MSIPLPTLSVWDWVSIADVPYQVVELRSRKDRVELTLLGADGESIRGTLGLLSRLAGWKVLDDPLEGHATSLREPVWWKYVAAHHRRQAEWLEVHLMEVQFGWQHGVPPSMGGEPPQPKYDPDCTTLEDRVAAKANELRAANVRPSSRTAIWEALKKWNEGRRFALLDGRYVRPAKKVAASDPRLVQAIEELAAAAKNETTGDHNKFARNLKNKLDADYGPGVVPVPAKTSLWRIIQQVLGAYDYTFEEAKTRRQNHMPDPDRGMFSKVRSDIPGYIEIDSTPLNIRIVFEYDDNDKVSWVEYDNCVLTAALDVATQSVVAWQVTPPDPNGADFSYLLAQMMCPEPFRPGWDDTLRYRYNLIPLERLVMLDERFRLAANRPVILPRVITMDRGSIQTSAAAEAACARYGITLQHTRPHTGQDKPHIERWNRTLESKYGQHAAGAKGRNTLHRGGDPEGKARWTSTQLEELFAEFVCAVWQDEQREGLTHPARPGLFLSPNQMYAALSVSCGFVYRPFNAEHFVALLPFKKRTIRRVGIQSRRLYYDSPAIDTLRGMSSGLDELGGKWIVHEDKNDITNVYLRDDRDPDNPRILTVPWVEAKRLSGPVSDALLRAVLDDMGPVAAEAVDQAEIARRLEDLQNRLEAGPKAETKKKVRTLNRSRTRAANTRRARRAHQLDTEKDAAEPNEDQAPSKGSVVPMRRFTSGDPT